MIRIAVGALAVTVVAALTGCTPPHEIAAASLADRISIAMADDIAPPHYPEPLSGEHLAWMAVHAPRLPPEQDVEYAFGAFDWAGNSGDHDGARFSVRIDVHILPLSGGFGSPNREESSAVRCWRFVVRAIPEWQGAVERSAAPCPDGALSAPEPEALLTMPDDVEPRLIAALTGATLADVEDRVRAEFPEPGWSVVADEREGVLAVALGISREQSCVVGVLHPDASIEIVRGFSPESLLPGELGCDPMLYFGGISPG